MSMMSDGESDGYASPDRDYDEYYDHWQQIEQLYNIFVRSGESLFGTSFHQLGNWGTFVDYVERTTLLSA